MCTMAKANSNFSDIEGPSYIADDFFPEPSRPPATPIDAVIDEEEVHMFQYINEMAT